MDDRGGNINRNDVNSGVEDVNYQYTSQTLLQKKRKTDRSRSKFNNVTFLGQKGKPRIVGLVQKNGL